MGRLKTLSEKMLRKRVVQKRQANGRCYNDVDGKGWNHYTKGFRKHSTHSNVVSRGTIILFGFLAKMNTNAKNEEVKE